MSQAIKVLRGSSIISSGQSTLTLTEGVDFTLDVGVSSDQWFCMIANSRYMGMGRTSGGGSQNLDDVGVYITYSGNNIIFNRTGTSNNNRVDWQIVQYVGSPGGSNEFIVREKSSTSYTGISTSFAYPGTVSDANDLVPFITGQTGSNTGRNEYHSAIHTVDVTGGNIVVTRGKGSGTAYLSYALVEFVGSGWTVTKESYVNPSGSGLEGNVTLGTPLSDFTKAFIHDTYTYTLSSGSAGLDDVSVRVRLVSNTEIGIFDRTSTGDFDKSHITYIIQNPDMSVERYNGTMVGSGEEEVFDVTITSVPNSSNVLTTLYNDSTGGGTAFPRGLINHFLLDSTTLRLRQSDNGQTSTYAVEIITLPEDPSTGAQAKRWDGASWVNVTVRGWDGSAWTLARFWDGSSWIDQ